MIRRVSYIFLSFWLALASGPSGAGVWVVAEIATISAGALLAPVPASAQTARRSGGYGLPGGGAGSYAAPSRRPSPSSGGYGGAVG